MKRWEHLTKEQRQDAAATLSVLAIATLESNGVRGLSHYPDSLPRVLQTKTLQQELQRTGVIRQWFQNYVLDIAEKVYYLEPGELCLPEPSTLSRPCCS